MIISWNGCSAQPESRRRCRHEASDPFKGYVYAAALVTSQCAGAALRVTHVGCPDISVASLDRSVAFYTGMLEFSLAQDRRLIPPGAAGAWRASRPFRRGLPVSSWEKSASTLPSTGRRVEHPFLQDSRANDGWFEHIAIVVYNMDKAYASVCGVRVPVLCRTSRKPFPSGTKKQRALSRSTFATPTGITSN